VGHTREADPSHCLGKADDIVEETGESTRCTAGVWDPASKERLSEITSEAPVGSRDCVQPAKTLQTRLNAEAGESPTGVAHEPVGAMTEG
jgi:hypothetical protein